MPEDLEEGHWGARNCMACRAEDLGVQGSHWKVLGRGITGPNMGFIRLL